MNSDNLVNFFENLVGPVESNKFVKGLLLVVLLVSTGYFVPHPILPSSVYKALQNYKVLGFICTLLLAHLLTRDMSVSLVATVLIFSLHYITRHFEGFEPVDYTNLLINEYNYNLDKVVNKKKANHNVRVEFKRPQEEVVVEDTNPEMPEINNINSKVPVRKLNKKQKQGNACCQKHLDDDFEFNQDSLRYLNYNGNKIQKFEQAVYADSVPNGSPMPFDEFQ